MALCGIGLLQIVCHGESWCVVKDAESWCWGLAMVLDAWTSRDNLHCKQRETRLLLKGIIIIIGYEQE